MSLPELLSALQELNRADKLRAVQFLVTELAKEEGVALPSEISLAVWSPYEAFDAANTLLEVLNADEGIP